MSTRPALPRSAVDMINRFVSCPWGRFLDCPKLAGTPQEVGLGVLHGAPGWFTTKSRARTKWFEIENHLATWSFPIHRLWVTSCYFPVGFLVGPRWSRSAFSYWFWKISETLWGLKIPSNPLVYSCLSTIFPWTWPSIGGNYARFFFSHFSIILSRCLGCTCCWTGVPPGRMIDRGMGKSHEESNEFDSDPRPTSPWERWETCAEWGEIRIGIRTII